MIDSALTSNNDSGHNVSSFSTVPANGYSLLGTTYGDTKPVDVSAFHLPNGGTITETCNEDLFSTGGTIGIFDMQITATQVAKVNG